MSDQSILNEIYKKDYLYIKDIHGNKLFIKKDTEELYILKCYPQDKASLVQILFEVSNFQEINIPTIKEIIPSAKEEKIYSLEKYIKGKTLNEYMASNTTTFKEIINIFLEVVKNIEKLNIQNIIHRDIKPQNIIITKNKIPFIIDFNISRLYRNYLNKDTNLYGTEYYAAPEQYGYVQTDYKTDIFALGKTMEEILEIMNINNSIINNLINKMTSFDPDNRPEYQKIKEILSSCINTEKVNNKQNKDSNKYFKFKKVSSKLFIPLYLNSKNMISKILINLICIPLNFYLIWYVFLTPYSSLKKNKDEISTYLNPNSIFATNQIFKYIFIIVLTYFMIISTKYLYELLRVSKFNNYYKYFLQKEIIKKGFWHIKDEKIIREINIILKKLIKKIILFIVAICLWLITYLLLMILLTILNIEITI